MGDLDQEIELDSITHDHELTAVSFCHHGRYLATGSIRMWDLKPVQMQNPDQTLEAWEQPKILEIARIPHEDAYIV